MNYSLNVVRGQASPEELAALAATLIASTQLADAEPPPAAPRSTWRGPASWKAAWRG